MLVGAGVDGAGAPEDARRVETIVECDKMLERWVHVSKKVVFQQRLVFSEAQVKSSSIVSDAPGQTLKQ